MYIYGDISVKNVSSVISFSLPLYTRNLLEKDVPWTTETRKTQIYQLFIGDGGGGTLNQHFRQGLSLEFGHKSQITYYVWGDKSFHSLWSSLESKALVVDCENQLFGTETIYTTDLPKMPISPQYS